VKKIHLIAPSSKTFPRSAVQRRALVRRDSEIDHLDAEQSGLIGLVAIPVLDDALGLAALKEELDGFVESVVYDTIEEQPRRLPVRAGMGALTDLRGEVLRLELTEVGVALDDRSDLGAPKAVGERA